MADDRRREALAIARGCLASRARHLDRTLARIYDGRLREHEITGAQLGMLVAIALSGTTTAVAIGRRLELEKSTVSRNLARLSAAGMVEIADGVRITPRGERAIRDSYPAWQEAQRHAAAAIGPRAQRLLAAMGTALER